MSNERTLYHLGCGETHLDGYVNVDVRPTAATDVICDLNELELPPPVEGFFSHAFFEHLLRDARVPHLLAARRLLADHGFVCYLGLPDFRAVAEHYLSRSPGVIGPTFDLYNVYRYTHGDPENVDYYFEQLHKSLFDVEELQRLLADAGFASYVAFGYAFPGEQARVNLGFFATPATVPVSRLRERAVAFLAQFDKRFLQLETLEFVDGRTRSQLQTRIAGSPLRRTLRPFTTRVARRLARI
ncbi:MAG TPA: hypothetical protein VGL51_17450 [Solirubrobacteraceae bacterium]|jgi:hypothetical protein